MRFGAHMSIAGGIDRAIDRAVAAGCEALQIFTQSPRQWSSRPLRDAEIEAFRRERRRHGIDPVVAHACYLINLASPDSALRRRSLRLCSHELARCDALGLDGLVLHPGSHGGTGAEGGLRRVADGLADALSRGDGATPILIEGTAGQGTSLGSRLEELRWLLEALDSRRVGVCLDTCHLHAAGLDLGTADACAHALDRVAAIVGFEHVSVLHCNDSVGAAGSRRDRHAHIGRGTIGTRGFRALLTDPRVDGVVAILETPKGDDGAFDRANLARLRAMHRGDRRLPPPPPSRKASPARIQRR